MRREIAEGRLKLPADGAKHAELVLTDGTVYAERGRVNFADARVNTSTGTIENRAVFANPAHSILPGQFVRVRVNGAVRPAAILVPQRAVLEGPQGKFVYVVRDGKAEVRPVELGEWRGDRWVIANGLAPGDEVVVDGVMKLQPGAPVKVANAGQNPPGPPSGVPRAPRLRPSRREPCSRGSSSIGRSSRLSSRSLSSSRASPRCEICRSRSTRRSRRRW